MATIRWRELGLVSLLLLLAACGQQRAVVATQASAPTIVVATDAPTPTALVRETLPPTWTPVLSYTPSITPTASITLTPSMTFTASQTFTPSATYTATNTPTDDATNLALLHQPLAAACAGFAPDPVKNSTQFQYPSAPTIYWTPVSTAAAYLLRLYDANRSTLLTQTTTDTQYTFKADLFELGQSYAWDVAPLDSDGMQICPSRGALLIAAS